MTTDHSDEQVFPAEPDGGWQTSPTLHDTELASVTLCRFTGLQPMLGVQIDGHLGGHECSARKLGGHADVDCLAVFVRQDLVSDSGQLAPGADVTVSLAGNEPNVIT